MDAELVRRANGRVVVSALAGSPGSDYRTATANGVRHFRALGAADVVGAPDARDQPVAAIDVLRSARLLVLPGGYPTRLLEALQQTAVGQLVAELLADDGVVMGASAGAMVLCPWTVLPDRRGDQGPVVEPGLGLVPAVVVLPHWRAGSHRADWAQGIQAKAGDGVQLLGLPEESGVIVEGTSFTAVGQSPSRLISQGRDLAIGERWDAA